MEGFIKLEEDESVNLAKVAKSSQSSKSNKSKYSTKEYYGEVFNRYQRQNMHKFRGSTPGEGSTPAVYSGGEEDEV